MGFLMKIDKFARHTTLKEIFEKYQDTLDHQALSTLICYHKRTIYFIKETSFQFFTRNARAIHYAFLLAVHHPKQRSVRMHTTQHWIQIRRTLMRILSSEMPVPHAPEIL